jgi:hypothetical protein
MMNPNKQQLDLCVPALLPGAPWPHQEAVPQWLQDMFNDCYHQDQMQALQKINSECININVSLN